MHLCTALLRELIGECCAAVNRTERPVLTLSADAFLWNLHGSHECGSAIVHRVVQLHLRPTHATTTNRTDGRNTQLLEWFDPIPALLSGSRRCVCTMCACCRVWSGVAG